MGRFAEGRLWAEGRWRGRALADKASAIRVAGHPSASEALGPEARLRAKPASVEGHFVDGRCAERRFAEGRFAEGRLSAEDRWRG